MNVYGLCPQVMIYCYGVYRHFKILPNIIITITVECTKYDISDSCRSKFRRIHKQWHQYNAYNVILHRRWKRCCKIGT